MEIFKQDNEAGMERVLKRARRVQSLKARARPNGCSKREAGSSR